LLKGTSAHGHRNRERMFCCILPRDAGERFIGSFRREIHQSNHLTELGRMSLVDRVTDVRQLAADLRRLTTQQPHTKLHKVSLDHLLPLSFNPLESRGNYSAMNNMKLVHWPLMGGLLYLVQRGGTWAGWEPAQSPPPCTKCNSPPINGQCIPITVLLYSGFVGLRF